MALGTVNVPGVSGHDLAELRSWAEAALANKANVGEWFALPLVNGAEPGNTYPNYKKQGDMVYLYGQIKGITPDIPFSVLPEGFHPGARRVCISPVNPGGTDTVCVTISLNGEIALTSHVEHAELFITLVFAI